jgi:hypothetical protein
LFRQGITVGSFSVPFRFRLLRGSGIVLLLLAFTLDNVAHTTAAVIGVLLVVFIELNSNADLVIECIISLGAGELGGLVGVGEVGDKLAKRHKTCEVGLGEGPKEVLELAATFGVGDMFVLERGENFVSSTT